MKVSAGSNGSFQDPPVGVHLARCIGVVDLGTQKREWQGKISFVRKVMLKWELPETVMDDEHGGKPFVVVKFYTASLNEKANLRADLVNWRGREFTQQELEGFEMKNLLDKICMVSLTKDSEGKVRVTGIMGKPAGVNPATRVNDLFYLSLDPEEYKPELFESLSEKMQEMIRKSPEWIALQGEQKPRVVAQDDFADDIPF